MTMHFSLSAATLGLIGLTMGEAVEAGAGPWLVGAMVSMGGFLALIVRWLMQRQDAMHAENREREKVREEREERRADAFQKEVAALEVMVEQLRQLNARQQQSDADRKNAVDRVLEGVAGIPDRVVDELFKQGAVRRGPT